MIRTTQTSRPASEPVDSIRDRMVDKMLEMGMNGIAVTADSLLEHSDFTRDEIKALAAGAADEARARSVRQRQAA